MIRWKLDDPSHRLLQSCQWTSLQQSTERRASAKLTATGHAYQLLSDWTVMESSHLADRLKMDRFSTFVSSLLKWNGRTGRGWSLVQQVTTRILAECAVDKYFCFWHPWEHTQLNVFKPRKSRQLAHNGSQSPIHPLVIVCRVARCFSAKCYLVYKWKAWKHRCLMACWW